MPLTAPERARRDEAAAKSSDALARALADADATQTEVAEAVFRQRQHIGEMADRMQTRSMNLRDLLLLPKAVRVALLRRLAEVDDLLVVSKPKTGGGRHSMQLGIDAHRESSEAVAMVLAMLADGIVTRKESGPTKKELVDAVQAFQRLIELCEEVDREGVVALHPAGSER